MFIVIRPDSKEELPEVGMPYGSAVLDGVPRFFYQALSQPWTTSASYTKSWKSSFPDTA
jgi:hypothetical protein